MLPNNIIAFRTHLSGLRRASNGLFTAEEVVQAVLATWMQAQYPQLAVPQYSDEIASLAAVQKYSSWLGAHDVITGAFWLSSSYAALVSPDVRKASALYFTPPSLSKRLLDNVETHKGSLVDCRLIDPACGGAAFLVPATVRISAALKKQGASSDEIISRVESNLHGIDSNAFLSFLSNWFIRMVLAEHIGNTKREPQLNILTGDGLSDFEDELGGFDVVLCNPPYRKMTSDEVSSYVASYKEVIRGQPNLYSLFMLRSLELLKPDGVAGLLTPMSFLSGQSFLGVRNAFCTKGRINQLDLIHDKNNVFLSAEQETVITTCSKNSSIRDATRIFCLTGTDAPRASGTLRITQSEVPWPIPRESQDIELLPLFDNPPASLKSYGYLPKTGAIVIHRDKRTRYKSLPPDSFGAVLTPLIWSRNIDSAGQLLTERGMADTTDRFVDMGTIDHTSIVKKPAVAVQRVSSADQKRRLTCAAVPQMLNQQFNGVVGENHVLFLEQADSSSLVPPELLSAILRTETIDRLFRCISGATNVSAYELSHLPLPSPEKVISAIQEGKDIDLAVRIGFGLTEVPDKTMGCFIGPNNGSEGINKNNKYVTSRRNDCITNPA